MTFTIPAVATVRTIDARITATRDACECASYGDTCRNHAAIYARRARRIASRRALRFAESRAR